MEKPRTSSDLATRKSQLKKYQKIAKKNLSGEFSSVSEDISSDITADSSPISQISSDHLDGLVAEKFVVASNRRSSDSSETSNVTPVSKITATADERGDVSVDRYELKKAEGPMEAEIVANLLKRAGIEILNSADVDNRSKKLLDSLIKYVIDECYSLPEERDRCAELLSMKGRIVFICFLLWSFAAFMIVFFGSGFDSSYSGPLPT